MYINLQIEKNRSDRGGFMSSMSGPRKLDSGFSDMSISSSGTGFGSGSGFGLSTDVDSFSSKPKGLHYYPKSHMNIVRML